MMRILLAVIALSQIIGCAAPQFQTRMTDALFVQPVDVESGTPYVYVRARNTSGYDALDISEGLKSALNARGYRVTQHPSKAHYTLDVQVLHVEEATHANVASGAYGGFGAPVAGAVFGAVIGKSWQATGAGFLGGLVGNAIARTAFKDKLYVAIADVQVGERAVGLKQQTRSATQSGSSTTTTQQTGGTGEWLYHRARLISDAAGTNMKLEEAIPGLRQKMVSSLSGIF